MDRQATVFAVLPGEQVCGHWHGVEFVGENELAERRGTLHDNGAALVLPLTDAALRDKFWVTFTWEIISTSEVIRRFASGVTIKGYTGPHDTEADASNCVDAAWEAPGDD